MIINREYTRARGLRMALRVAGLAGVVVVGISSAEGATTEATEAPHNVDDSVRNIQTHPVGGCWNPRFWGPPAPVDMLLDAMTRLRTAMRCVVASMPRRTT